VNLEVLPDKYALAMAAAARAATTIRRAIQQRGMARIIAATGASQFEFLEQLTRAEGIDWEKVEMFHLDEYLGLPLTHPASFRKYLRERLIDKVLIKKFHLLDGEGNPGAVISKVTEDIRKGPIDIAFVGIGENGHLAFNDPPADFETDEAYIVVELDEDCRKQQLGEGWFKSLQEVPKQALSMTVRQVLKSKQILCVVPDSRKAVAVRNCFEGEISPMHPASILRTHPDTYVYLDEKSAALLQRKSIGEIKT
jgi:glucosamine-6-phosphate deaminase